MAFEKVKEIIKESPAFTQLTDLSCRKIGRKVLYATDDFFAEKENLIAPTRGVFITDKYTDRGKWMDGWESRRKRTPGHDWAVIQLATSGKIAGFDIDTNFFLGNHPPHASIEAVNLAKRGRNHRLGFGCLERNPYQNHIWMRVHRTFMNAKVMKSSAICVCTFIRMAVWRVSVFTVKFLKTGMPFRPKLKSIWRRQLMADKRLPATICSLVR